MCFLYLDQYLALLAIRRNAARIVNLFSSPLPHTTDLNPFAHPARNNEGDHTSLSRLVTDAVNFANDDDTWTANKDTFMMHTGSGDRIRHESFWKTFPELNKLQDLTE